MTTIREPYVKRYNCSESITIQDVQRHRRLYNYLLLYWRNNRLSLNFPEPSDIILHYVPQLCFVPCFLLAYTCCRFGELKQIKISDILNRQVININSSKSKHTRQIPALSDFKPAIRMSIDPNTLVYVISYDHLKNTIHKAKKRGKLPPIPSALDVTHVFRHYEATYLNSKGLDIDSISERLGHLNRATTLKYIH